MPNTESLTQVVTWLGNISGLLLGVVALVVTLGQYLLLRRLSRGADVNAAIEKVRIEKSTL